MDSIDYIEYTRNWGRWPRIRGSLGNENQYDEGQQQGPYLEFILPLQCISAINITCLIWLVYSSTQVGLIFSFHLLNLLF